MNKLILTALLAVFAAAPVPEAKALIVASVYFYTPTPTAPPYCVENFGVYECGYVATKSDWYYFNLQVWNGATGSNVFNGWATDPGWVYMTAGKVTNVKFKIGIHTSFGYLCSNAYAWSTQTSGWANNCWTHYSSGALWN